jgi:hypothetical protein
MHCQSRMQNCSANMDCYGVSGQEKSHHLNWGRIFAKVPLDPLLGVNPS